MIIIIAITILGLAIGLLVDDLAEKTIEYKEKKREKNYQRYSITTKLDTAINIAVVTGLFLITYFYFTTNQGIFAAIYAVISIVTVRIDQKVRIIPNEIVLAVLTISAIYQLTTNGLKGLINGIIAMAIVAVIFFLSAFITKAISGSLGVGAGDIKLSMAIGVYMGLGNLSLFFMGIIIFLSIYVLGGIRSKMVKIGDTFPMATQIAGGFMLAIYGEAIIDLISKIL